MWIEQDHKKTYDTFEVGSQKGALDSGVHLAMNDVLERFEVLAAFCSSGTKVLAEGTGVLFLRHG